MSTVRRLTIPVVVAGAIAVLGAGMALAQAGPTNPSGGTSLSQTRFEAAGSISSQPTPILRELPGQAAWQTWFGFTLSRYGFSATTRAGDWRSMSAVVRRSPARR